jgi:hypothetical protein
MSGQGQAPPVTADDFRLLNDHNLIAAFSIAVAGYRIDAALSLSGQLRLPPGVNVSRRERRSARDAARRLALAKLSALWSRSLLAART